HVVGNVGLLAEDAVAADDGWPAHVHTLPDRRAGADRDPRLDDRGRVDARCVRSGPARSNRAGACARLRQVDGYLGGGGRTGALALDDGAPRPVGDAQGGTGRQRAGVDDAVRLLAAVQEVDRRFVEPRWLAAEPARA